MDDYAGKLEDEHLAAILRALPQLQSLTLTLVRQTSLRCLAETPHLAHTLQRLQITRWEGLPVTELKHLQPLRALRDLLVVGLTGWSLSSIRERLTPGHAKFDRRRWPHLTSAMLIRRYL